MGQITQVKKSRKAYKCSRCGKEIPVGSEYLRGDLNFSKPIIRCVKCGLQSWEVTTSDFQLRAGEAVYRWEENYSTDAADLAETVESLKSDLEELRDELRDELQDRLDNMPESLQDSDTGNTLQERIDSLDEAISELESVDAEFDEEEDGKEEFEERVKSEIESALGSIEV